MAIESAFNSNSFPLSSLGEVGEDLPIEIVDSESLILETDDGGMMIEFDPEPVVYSIQSSPKRLLDSKLKPLQRFSLMTVL